MALEGTAGSEVRVPDDDSVTASHEQSQIYRLFGCKAGSLAILLGHID